RNTPCTEFYIFAILVVLMFEMPYPGQDHAHAMGITEVYALLVFNGTAWLHDRRDTFLAGYLHTIRKREEGVRRHNGTLKVKSKRFGFFNGLLQSIYPRSLAHTTCK